MTFSLEEMDKQVDAAIEEYGYDKTSLVVREAVRNNILFSRALTEKGNFTQAYDLIEIPESEFIQYFLPALIRPALADKKPLLVRRVGGWQKEFRVISDVDRSLLFVAPPLINGITFEEKIQWGEKEIKTNHLVTEMVSKSKLLADSGVNTKEADALAAGLTDVLKFDTTKDQWQQRWLEIFKRYEPIVSQIVKVHANEFTKDGKELPLGKDVLGKETMSLDDFE